MVKDAAGNLNGKWDRFTFKTISGSTSYNDYGNPLPSIPNIPTLPGNVNDTVKPTFVSMWPADGAGDVLASPISSGPNGTLADASVYLFFDEPVKFNASAPGLIQIVNNTNKVVGSINLTYEYVVSAAPVVGHVVEMNATKITIGQYLKKDQNFTISVPAGVIVDMRNNPISAFTKTFKTLSENADTVAPVAVRATPYDGQSVLSSAFSFGVWFSERVVPGAGSITIKTGSATSVTMDITDANVTIAGPKMTFSFYSGALSTAGAWKLVLPPGLLKDEAGNQYRGLNATGGAPSQDFTVVAKDTTKPTLSSQLPATEATATYVEEKTTALQLTFDEAVQAASTGAIVFTPKYTSPTLSVAASSSEVAIKGALVVVSPMTDLMAGEVYSITIESGAFTDIQAMHSQG
jgi:methionine-rich copper-binding protein CopC